MPSVLFGSISTLADTSELQRTAFNKAFADHGLDWEWSQDEYRTLLDSNGGAARIDAYATARGEKVNSAAVHATKSTIFQQDLASTHLTARPGVVDVIQAAKQAGYGLGFVTTTAGDNVLAVFAALAPQVGPSDFDVVISAGDVEAVKPDPAAYSLALSRLGETPAACVAVEDNPGGAQAAAAAGIACLAFPNENTAGLDFGAARPVGDRLDFDELRDSLTATSTEKA